MKRSHFILGLIIGLAVLCSACSDDQPGTTIDLGFDKGNTFYTGEWSLDEVEYICLSPNAVRLSASDIGDCIEEYCHTGSTLFIKNFDIPGYFEYSISPPVRFLNGGDNKFFNNYTEFYDTFGVYGDGIQTYHPVGVDIGSVCYVSFKWKKIEI